MIENLSPTRERIFCSKYTIEAGDVDSVGYATISNTGALLAFTGATVPAIPSATYDIDITIDGGALRQLAIAILNTDSWTVIVAAIQTALRAATGALETVEIASGKIKVTSVTTGATSSVLIAAGTLGSGGGDLLAAIDALGADYTVTLDTPVAGAYGSVTLPLTTSTTLFTNFAGRVVIKDSTGIDKIANIVKSYSSGNLTVTNTATSIVVSDVITVMGILY